MAGCGIIDYTSGDPEVVNVVPTGQYLNSSVFYADLYVPGDVAGRREGQERRQLPRCHAGARRDADRFSAHRNEDNTSSSESTCPVLQPGDRFDGFDGGSVCRYGMQRMHSDGPFTATLWGWGYFELRVFGAARRCVSS